MDVRIAKEIALLFRSDAFFFSYELGIDRHFYLYYFVVLLNILNNLFFN
jgi:hypothetical protein